MDLNLLTALDALLEENSVQAAADRLHLSPPAMSRTLARIRRATGDDILVRTGRTMTPTPRALAVRDEAHELVRRAHELLSPPGRLDLSTLHRTFTVQGHDALIGALGPALFTAVVTQAWPGVRVRLLAEAAGDTFDLARGHVDLEVGASGPAAPEISSERVGEDELVVAVRAGHPLLRAPATADALAAVDHIIVSRRGRLADPLDDAFAKHGLHRRVVASVPTSTAALQLAAHTDAAVVVAERMCRPLCTALSLQARKVPVQLPAVPVVLAWHSRYDTDRAHMWLRAQVRTTLNTLLHPS